jgi:hypothetical protein
MARVGLQRVGVIKKDGLDDDEDAWWVVEWGGVCKPVLLVLAGVTKRDWVCRWARCLGGVGGGEGWWLAAGAIRGRSRKRKKKRRT